MADDFFVRFGSNARIFSRDLESDLQPSFEAISKLGRGLQALEVTAAGKRTEVAKHLAAINEEAAEVQRRLDAIGDPGSTGETAELQAIARQAVQTVAEVVSDVQAMSTQLGEFVKNIGRAGEEYKAAETTRRQSESQRAANDKRARGEGGNFVSPGTPGAQPVVSRQPDPNLINQVAQAAAAATESKAAPVQTVVRIEELPKTTIDEAAFARVLAASQANAEGTNQIVTAIDRVASILERSRVFQGAAPGRGEVGGEVDSQVAGLAKLTKEQNQQLYRAFGDILRTTFNDAGPDAQQKLWRQLVANQQKALAAGTTIIPSGAEETAPQERGQSRLAKLEEQLGKLGARADTLRSEIEPLANALEAARNGGREAAGDAEVLARKLNELAQVEERMASVQTAFTNQESRAEQRERQRRAALRAAAQQAGLTDTPEERARKRQERGNLELATQPDRLRELAGTGAGQLSKRDLQGIAETLTRQGYGVNLGSVRPETGVTRLTVDELIKRIGEGGAQYLASGRATAEDLRVRREAPGSNISGDVVNRLADTRVAQMTQRFTQELGRLGLSAEKAYQLIGASLRSGGQDPRVESDPRNIGGSNPDAYKKNPKTARGRLEVGAAIGDELRAELGEAADVIDAFNREVRAAARADVVDRLRQDPLGYNPLSGDRTIQGKGPEAADARRQIGALDRALAEVDDFARDLHKLDDQVTRTERAWVAVTRALADYESLERKPTDQESEAYTRNVERQRQIEENLERQRAARDLKLQTYSDHEGGSADYLRSPGYREGLRRRDEYRVQLRPDERTGRSQYIPLDQAYSEYENRDVAERRQNHFALQSAVFDYLGRSRVFATDDGNTRDYTTRNLPGVRSAGTVGRQRLEFIDPETMLGDPETRAANERALRRMTAGTLGYSANLQKLIQQVADGDSSEEELNETRAKVRKALDRLLAGYQTAFPSNPVPDERSYLPPQLFGDSPERTSGEEQRLAEYAENQERARERVEKQREAAFRAAERSRPRDDNGFAAPASGGSGSGGGSGTRPTAAGAEEPGRGNGDILRQILAAINKVDGTLKGGLKVNGNITATERASRRQSQAARPTGAARSTEAGRADFEASIAESLPAVAALIQGSQDVEAAAQLVSRGVLSETRVIDFFRDKLKLTAQEAKAFGAEVRAAVGNAQLASAAAAAADQQQKEQAKLFQTRNGETLSIQQARKEMREELADRKRQAQAIAQSSREEREAAVAVAQHARAMASLGPEARAEVAQLERLVAANKAGTASAAELAAQMAKVYGLAAQDLGQQGARATEVNQTVGRIYEGAGIDSSGKEIEGMRREARGLGYQVDRAAAEGAIPGGLFGEQSAFTRAMFGNHGFWSRVMSSTGTFVVRNFTAGFVFGLTNALSEVIREAIQTEATFVRVSHALEATGRSADGLRGDLQDISTDLGTNLNDVYQTAAGLTGLFKTPLEIAGATRVVSQLQLISSGALNAQEAMGTLASIQGAFGEQLGGGIDGLTHVADVLTSVQNDIGTNVEVTAEGVGRMSGLAHQLGLSLEEVAVYSAQISKLTNQTGAAAGEQFSRILSVMQTGRGRSAIAQAFGTVDGQDTGIEQQLAARDYSAVLRTMSANWDKLTDAQKQNVSVSIAGQRQAAAFAALMANGTQSLDAIARAENSHGAAAERTEKIMRTLNGQIARLGSNLQNVANNLIRSGILNFILVILQGANALLGTFNSIFSTVNDFADSNPILNWLTNVGFGLAGLALALVLVKRSFAGLKATLNEMPSVQNFRAGYGAASAGGASGGRGFRDGLRDRGVGAIERVTPTTRAEREPLSAGVLSRTTGRVLDRIVVPPFLAVGRGATGLADVLRERAERIRTYGQTSFGPAIDPELAARQQGRARRVDRSASAVAAAGGFFGGIGNFGRELFQGRGADYFGGVSQRRRDDANYYSSAATDLRRSADRENDPQAARRLRTQATGLQALAGAQGLASRATSGLSRTMGALSSSGLLADGALGAVALGVAAVTYAMDQNAKAGRRVKDVIDERTKIENARQGNDEVYAGPASEAYKQMQEELQDRNGLSTSLEFGGQTLKRFFTEGIGGATDFGGTFDKMFGTEGFGGQIEGLDDAQKALNDGIKKVNDYAKQGSRDAVTVQVDSGALAGLSAEVLEGFTTPTDGIRVAAREQARKFADMEQKVNENKGLSNQQKLAALYAIEQARNEFTSMVEDRISEAEGIAAKGLLDIEQLKRITATLPTLQGLQASPDVLRDLRGGVQGLIEETGISEDNPLIKEYLDKLARGGLSAIDAAKGQTEVIRELAKQAEIKYQAALETGETDQIDDAREQMVSLMNQLAQSAEQNVQTFVQTATTLSQTAFANGQFEQGRADIDQAIRDIESQKPKGTTYVDGGRRETRFTSAELEQRAAFEAQQRQLIDSRNQATAQELNAPLARQSARGLGELGSARNQVQQARNSLRVLRQARQQYGPLGATFQQIQDARNAVLQAEATLAGAVVNKRTAALANQAAGTWNQARQDNLAVQQAALALEQAIQRYGEDSIEALNAMAGLAAANKTRVQNADQRAAARRETALASIPQGNQVGVSQQALANAQAGVAAAEKYGRNSTEYQSALQTLYGAQQQAASATAGIAVAQAQLAQAYAEARGDAVAAARAGVAVARATLAQALQASGGAQSAEVLSAQAQLVAANQAVQDAQVALVQSRIQVTIALAEAAGQTVRASRLQIASAIAALHAETPGTAEYNQAKAEVISARAAARDAELQDKLDTIDFNLQMGKITQSSAIAALQQILKTSDLTKAQRRQLLLQIKGMKDELAQGQWNFGDIKLPTPYQMRAYIAGQRDDLQRQLDASAAGGRGAGGFAGQAAAAQSIVNNTQTTTVNIPINGADTAKVKKIITEVVGGSGSTTTRTTGARRG